MKCLSDSAPMIAGRAISSRYPGHGIRGGDVPTGGAHGPAILYPGLTLPGEANDEFRAQILTRPGGLTWLVIGEDSSIEAEGPPGSYSGTWRGYKNGAVYGPNPSTYTIVIGAGLSGGATLDDVAAAGGMGSVPSGLSGGAALDDVAAGGGLGGGTPSGLAGGATLDDVGAGGGLIGVLPPSGELTGDATLDSVDAGGNLFGGAPSVLPRAIMDQTPTATRIVRAGRTTPTYLQPLDVEEVDDVHFDFLPAIVGVEPILALAVTCEARVGVDAAAAAMRVGDPVFSADAGVQRIRGGLADVIYLLRATATLASGRKVVATAFLPVVSKL